MTQTLSDEVATTPRSAPDEPQTGIAGIAGTAKRRARDMAGEQKNASAEQMGRAAGAIHRAAAELEQHIPLAAEYVHDAAARLESAAAALRESSVDELLDRATRLARAQPLVFFGGAVLAGFAISRFLKSSGEHPREPRNR